jgi:hypothetical protein
MATPDTDPRPELVTLPPRSEEELRGLAIARIEKRAEFRNHALAYLLVNGMLIAIWAITSGGFFWPMFPILGWGIGLAFHALETYRPPVTEDRIAREMARLAPRDRTDGR